MARMEPVLEWLLEPSQPAVRYLTMRDLAEASSSELKDARREIDSRGWVADILSAQKPGGFWQDGDNLYRPKYISTNWILLTLSDLGMTREDGRISRACELWIDRFSKPDGGFNTEGKGRKSEHCLTGNTTRALIKFGYVDHPRVKEAFEWLVQTQKENGGWHCWGKNGTIDAWEGLSAFAVYPRQKWTKRMKASVERGCEFYLAREMCKQGAHYEPWFRFHFPYHYYYDLLLGLEFMTALGYSDDPRLDLAVSHLNKKMRKDGRWNLDAPHPDYDNNGKLPDWWEEYKSRFHPFALEKVDRPSKMITLRALVVKKRLEERGRQGRP
jgi:hypothetical protein